jgi:hypothetical protein
MRRNCIRLSIILFIINDFFARKSRSISLLPLQYKFDINKDPMICKHSNNLMKPKIVNMTEFSALSNSSILHACIHTSHNWTTFVDHSYIFNTFKNRLPFVDAQVQEKS